MQPLSQAPACAIARRGTRQPEPAWPSSPARSKGWHRDRFPAPLMPRRAPSLQPVLGLFFDFRGSISTMACCSVISSCPTSEEGTEKEDMILGLGSRVWKRPKTSLGCSDMSSSRHSVLRQRTGGTQAPVRFLYLWLTSLPGHNDLSHGAWFSLRLFLNTQVDMEDETYLSSLLPTPRCPTARRWRG